MSRMTSPVVGPFTQIAVINASTVVSDTSGAIMTAALNALLPQFCKDWYFPICTATYYKLGTKANTVPIALKLYILDTADVKDSLGYHDEANDVPYGRIFAKTILQYRGVILYSANSKFPTVAQTLCHEAFEMLGDLRCNGWWMLPDRRTLYAAETCDPVQNNVVVVNISGQLVGCSDWVLPAWADAQNTKGPFNHLNTLKKPFTMSSGGYLIVYQNGSYKQIYGVTMPQWVRELNALSYRAAQRSVAAGVGTLPRQRVATAFRFRKW